MFLRVDDLRLSYGKESVLEGVNLTLSSDERIAILGKSGAGKSSLLKCLAALVRADSGEATIGELKYMANGRILVEPWKVRQQIGLVLQNFGLFPNMTVRSNIAIALRKVKKQDRSDSNALTEKIKTGAPLMVKSATAPEAIGNLTTLKEKS